MASFPRPGNISNRLQGDIAESPGQFTVHGLFRRYMQYLSALPGETSQFNKSEFGYEWRCEFEIGIHPPASARTADGQPLQLHFSLLDLEGQSRTAAVLYLVENGREPGIQDRLLLPLQDLTATHEQLNEQLTRHEASRQMFDNARAFITALSRVREVLDKEVVWA